MPNQMKKFHQNRITIGRVVEQQIFFLIFNYFNRIGDLLYKVAVYFKIVPKRTL